MTAYDRGDVVLVGFTFSAETGQKLRPGVIISAPMYQRRRHEVVIAAITSNIKRRLFGDTVSTDWKQTGLLYPSSATGIIRTIKRTMIHRKLGSMSQPDMEAIDRTLRECFGL